MDPIDSIVPLEILAAVRGSADQGMPIYLVGGAVRDALLGGRAHDLDFTLHNNIKRTARKIADALGAAFYALDDERGNYRLIYTGPAGVRRTIDFAGMRGETIEWDLRARDFTINAMALNVIQSGPVIDPTGGSQDLKNKILRECSETAMRDDPVRILRGLRLAAVFGLHIDQATRESMGREMSSLERVSPERKRDEVFRILETERPSVPLRGLEMLGGLPYLFPDLVYLQSTQQTNPHYQNVWDHTLLVVDHLGALLDLLAIDQPRFSGGNLIIAEASQRLGRYRPQLAHHFQQEISPGRNVRSLVNLAALYHDAAKPETMTVEPDGRIRNFGHEKSGANLVYHLAQHAALSRQECDRLRTIVGHHMRIHSLAATGRPPTRRAVYRYFRDTGEAGIDICLLTLADTLGTYGPALPQDTWLATLEVCRVLMEAWWEKHEEQINPLILLNGHEIQDLFHIDPGPKLGELLDNLHETQAAGQVATRAEAIEYIQKMLDNG